MLVVLSAECCRYDRCLRAGMRPDLVLDDDDKRKRFRKWFSPTSGSEDQQQQQRTSSVERLSRQKPAEIILDDGDGGETENEEEIPPPDLALPLDVENMLAELTQDESFVDPETGEVSQPSAQPGCN